MYTVERFTKQTRGQLWKHNNNYYYYHKNIIMCIYTVESSTKQTGRQSDNFMLLQFKRMVYNEL